jgi:hypothetical protein
MITPEAVQTPAGELAIPESKELARELSSQVLYRLEEAGHIAKEVLDERVVEWAEAGWIGYEPVWPLGWLFAVPTARPSRT